MSKAEEKAFKKYPDYRGMDGGYITQRNKRMVYIEGYHQAEKDNELTWEDIERIFDIHTEIKYEDSFTLYSIEFYQEVLKRFKAQKGE